MTLLTHAPDCTCDSCETAIRRVFGQVILPSPFATFRGQTAELLGLEGDDVPTADILAALRMRNRRIADLERRWSDARALNELLLHRLDAVRACLLADDVDGAKLLLSEAAPGAEGTHGAGPGAAEQPRLALGAGAGGQHGKKSPMSPTGHLLGLLRIIQTILGHRDPSTTARYARASQRRGQMCRTGKQLVAWLRDKLGKGGRRG